MGAIQLGSNNQLSQESSIIIPQEVDPDQIILVDSIVIPESIPQTQPSVLEHIQAKDSVIELASEGQIPDQGVLDSIGLPSSVPSPELIGVELINPLDNTIKLPDSLPKEEPILTEGSASVQIPDSIPSGEEILVEGITLTNLSPEPFVITGDKYYLYTQNVASDTWHVYHGLQKRPAVHIEDLTGQEIITQIVHVTNNYFRVHFGKPYVGTAHCN